MMALGIALMCIGCLIMGFGIGRITGSRNSISEKDFNAVVETCKEAQALCQKSIDNFDILSAEYKKLSDDRA